MSLFDRFADRGSRQNALEVALVACLLLEPALLDGLPLGLRVSRGCAWVVDLIADYSAACRVALRAMVRIWIRVDYRYRGDTALLREILALARDVEEVRALDVAAVGSGPAVADMLTLRLMTVKRGDA